MSDPVVDLVVSQFKVRDEGHFNLMKRVGRTEGLILSLALDRHYEARCRWWDKRGHDSLDFGACGDALCREVHDMVNGREP